MTSNQHQHKGNSRHSVIVPYRIGLLLDKGDQAHRDLHDALILGIEQYRASGALDRPIEIDVAEVQGAPDGSVLDVAAAWKTMNADRMLMAMVGPFGDANGAALAEGIAEAAIPTLTYSPADDYSGRYVFQLPLGHPADVMHHLLDYATNAGVEKIALVREGTSAGAAIESEYRSVAWQRQQRHVHVLECNSSLSERLHEIAPQAVLYLGGTHHAEVTAALDQAGVSALRLTGIEIASAHPALGRAADLEGWIGLDTIDPANRVFAQFSAAFSARYKRDASHAYAAVGYDMGRLLAAVLAVVRPPSPEGVRAGLDTTRMVQSATGKAGTVISFARYDHRGFKGDPFVLVRVEDAGITPISQR